MLFIVIASNVRIEERMNIVGSVESSRVPLFGIIQFSIQYMFSSALSHHQLLESITSVSNINCNFFFTLNTWSILDWIIHWTFHFRMNEKNISLMSIMLVLCYSYTCHVTRRVWIEVSVLDWEIWFALNFIYTFVFSKCFESLIFIVFICFMEEQSTVVSYRLERPNCCPSQNLWCG